MPGTAVSPQAWFGAALPFPVPEILWFLIVSRFPKISGLQKGPAGKGPRQKTSKIVKKCQKVFRHFSTLFDTFRAGQKTSKIAKKRQKVFRHFSTIFARHLFSGPFWGALTKLSWEFLEFLVGTPEGQPETLSATISSLLIIFPPQPPSLQKNLQSEFSGVLQTAVSRERGGLDW